jgi:hypothetical protein
MRNISAPILRMVLEQEGLPPCAAVETPLGTTPCFRHADGSVIVFVINRNDHACNIPVRLNLQRLGVDGNARVTDLSRETAGAGKPLGSDGEIEVSVEAHDVDVMRLTF